MDREKNGLGSPTGRNEQSGFVVYPEYRFHPERLKELDDKGYAEYENLLKQQQQHMKKRLGQMRAVALHFYQ